MIVSVTDCLLLVGAIVQAHRMLTSRWTPFAMRWAFPTAIDYYGVLRPRIIPSDAAIPSLIFRGDYAGSPVPLVRLSLGLGSIYTPEDLSCLLYLCTFRPYLSHPAIDAYVLLPIKRRKRTILISRTIPNVSSPVPHNDASTMVRFPSHTQARLAASSSVRVPRFCLHFPRGFRQVLAHCPLPARFGARTLR
jgi:hypothetical protein